MAYSLS